MNYFLDKNILKIKIDSLFVNTIQDFFDEYIPSKKIQHLLIQNKWITLDGNPVKRESDIVGINLEINIYPEQYSYKELNKNLLDVVYEDELLLVVNKPKGILVHSDGNQEITLTNMVESYLVNQNNISAYPLHRLDKETCGLVVFSKSIIFQPLFDKYLAEKKIRRNYLAFTKGNSELDKTIIIDKPIGKDRHDSNKRVVYKDGQPALTKVKCIAKGKGISLMKCSLDTGRTHQIRVHLASVGLGIINDELYGESSSLLNRMGLIANELDLYHPLKEDYIHLEIELPNDMGKLLNSLL